MRLPDAQATDLIGEEKLHDKPDPARESFVHVLTEIGGHDHHSLILLHFLKEVTGFDIGVTIVRIANFRSLAEQSISLVKEQDCIAQFGLSKDSREILFGLADIFADDAGQV